MNFNSNGSFDELNPRDAPAPKIFSATSISSTVPEVSLVFSPSPFPVKQVAKKTSQNLDHAQSSSSNYRIVNERMLPDSTYKTLPKGLREKCGLRPVKGVSHVSYLPSAEIQKGSDYMNDKLIENRDVLFRKTVPLSYRSDSKVEEHNAMCLHEATSYRLSPDHATQSVNSPAFHNGNSAPRSRTQLQKTSDLNVHNDVLHGSPVAAHHHHHHLENGMNINRILNRSPGCNQKGKSSVAFPFDDCCSYGKQQCCPSHSNCVLTQDMIDNSGSPSSACIPPISSNIPHHIIHSDASKHGLCCIPHVSSIEAHEKFENKSIGGIRSSKCASSLTDMTNKCNGYNAHYYENNIRFQEEMIPVNVSSVAQQNGHTVHKDKKRLETNLIISKDNMVNKTDGLSHASLQDSGAEIQCRDAQSNRNTISPMRASPKEKKQSDRSSDTSILQEIILMNQKQCSILQGLLQQVVAMQADQMKILSEINEKLSKTKHSENTLSKNTENITSKVFLTKENATTQTSVSKTEDVCCQKCNNRNEKLKSKEKNSFQNTPTNPAYEMNVESKNIVILPNHGGQEDVNKVKKLQDRAVSWSAVHGVETVEESFTLHGVCVPTVVDQLPSSVHTMHLHVQDYHSSASFDSIAESKHMSDSSCENGQDNQKGSWTLYDNIVGHVKKFLETVPCEKSGSASQKTSQVEAIRFATIEKIRQLGVSVYDNSPENKELNATGRIHFNSNVTSFQDATLTGERSSNDASMELQTLALKYLRDDDLCDLVKWNQSCKTPSILKTSQKSANISLATQHYLEKYHLLPPVAEYKTKRHINANCGQICVEDNILDITTLKRQPKLL